jgi:hypothetical protein
MNYLLDHPVQQVNPPQTHLCVKLVGLRLVERPYFVRVGLRNENLTDFVSDLINVNTLFLLSLLDAGDRFSDT